MAFSDAATGGTGYVAYAVESTPGGSGTPGTPVTPNLFVPVTDNSLKGPWDQVSPAVMRGTRMTKAILERARLKIMGTIDWNLNPSLGNEFFTTGLGATAAVTPVSAVQTTAPNTTSNGMTTLTVAGTFVKGAWVKINTSAIGASTASTELRQVSALSTGGTLVVGACVTNATTTTGTYVTQPAQTLTANSLTASGHFAELPTLTVDSVKTKWGWRFPGCYVDGLKIDLTKDEFKVQAAIMGSADPVYVASGSLIAYAPNASDEANALRPLTSIDGYIIAGGDPDASGTSALRAALGVQNVSIDFKNNNLMEPVFNGQHTYLVIPGDKAECQITYGEISTSKRPDVWTDLIQGSQAISFMAGAAKNYGTATTPNHGAVGFYSPTVKYSDDEYVEKIGAVNVANRKAEALAPAGSVADYVQMFCLKPS